MKFFVKENSLLIIVSLIVGVFLSSCFTLKQAYPIGEQIENWNGLINDHPSSPRLSLQAGDKVYRIYLELRPSSNDDDCEKVKYGSISGEILLHSMNGQSKTLPFETIKPRHNDPGSLVDKHTVPSYVGYYFSKFSHCHGAFEYEPVYFPHEIKEITFSIKGNLIFDDTIIPLDGSGVMEKGEWKGLWNRKS